MVEPRRQLCTALAVEYYLTCTDVTVSHPLIMHKVESPQNLLRQVLQD